MTTERDFHIFKGDKEWHVADRDGNLLFQVGSKTLSDAQFELRAHLRWIHFECVRDAPGDYSVYIHKYPQYEQYVGKTIDFISGSHYGNTPFSLVIVFTDGTRLHVKPSMTDFGHGDMASTLQVGSD